MRATIERIAAALKNESLIFHYSSRDQKTARDDFTSQLSVLLDKGSINGSQAEDLLAKWKYCSPVLLKIPGTGFDLGIAINPLWRDANNAPKLRVNRRRSYPYD